MVQLFRHAATTPLVLVLVLVLDILGWLTRQWDVRYVVLRLRLALSREWGIDLELWTRLQVS